MTQTDSLHALLTRRSTSVRDLTTPIPDAAQLEVIFRAATRVPDHGKLTPWRIIVLRDAGQRALGEIAAQQFALQYPEATPEQLQHQRRLFARAPLVVAVLSTPLLGTKPVWEQELSAGAVCMNMLHAIHMLGFGGKWLSEWVAYNPAILAALGGASTDKIAGFIYIGTKTSEPDDRDRPALSAVVREW